MKRGLKKILIIILILILTIGTFNCAKKIMIRNILGLSRILCKRSPRV